MSIWSAVGLADRNAVDRLVEQIESLRRENRELIAENQNLILSQINKQYFELYSADSQGTQSLTSKIQETYGDLYSQLNGISRLIYQQITADGESTREIMSSTKQKMEAAFSSESVQIKESMERLERAIAVDGNSSREIISQLGVQVNDRLSFTTKEHEKETNSVISSISDMKKTVSSQCEEIKGQISQALAQIFERQQQLSSDSCGLIVDANKDLVFKVEQYCTSALEEVKNTARNYQKMEQDEQENLERIRELSGEMFELSEHQKRIMEQLSQLCQDSDQFMEIQKSINNIWEIMKAVWIDSLLNDYEEGLKGSF